MGSNPKLHITGDGSHTLYSPQFDQFYHNPNGAISESRHVFFEQTGLLKSFSERTPITIFETGFGTGLNLLLVMDYLLKIKSPPPVTFISAEAHPIDEQLARNLNYDQFFSFETGKILSAVFSNLQKGWNQRKLLDDNILNLQLFNGYFDNLETDHKADFIFHDAFSPAVNPELWTVSVFDKLKSMSHPSTVLSTYCAASKARASMAAAGWLVARATGALGKREMTVAALEPDILASFKRVDEQRLIKRLRKNNFE